MRGQTPPKHRLPPKIVVFCGIDIKEYNLTVSDAINIFLNRVRIDGGLPFRIKVPSKGLKKAMKEVDTNDLVRYDSTEEMMHDLRS